MYRSLDHNENMSVADESAVRIKGEPGVSGENEDKNIAPEPPFSDKTPLEIKQGGESAAEEFHERRRNVRKKINLTGGYIVDGTGERGLINLMDVSFSGMRFKLNSMRFLYDKAMMVIKFTLDTFPKTVISRRVIIRNLDGRYIGAEFSDPDQYDGFSLYLKKIK